MKHLLLDDLPARYKEGWLFEVVCTETAQEYFSSYKGGWIIRCISNDEEEYYLTTFREKNTPRVLRSSFVVEKLQRETLSRDCVTVPMDEGKIFRFDKHGSR